MSFGKKKLENITLLGKWDSANSRNQKKPLPNTKPTN